MKLYRSISIEERGFPSEIYQAIVRLSPGDQQTDHFCLECQPGDESTAAQAESILALCERHGLRPARTAGEIGTYTYAVVRHYEPADLKTAPFLILGAQRKMFRGAGERDALGRLLLPATQAKLSIKIASVFLKDWYVVSDMVKKILESGGLIGLHFRETVLKGKSVYAADQPLWELDSNLTLPKMVNSLLNEHSVVPCYAIDERPYRYGEPHYRQHELRAIGDFDIARTFEPLGYAQGMVVSHRLYQHCLKNKIPIEGRPVRIDS